MVKKYSVPSSSALIAFESAARLLNFSRAAEELNTSQSAVSRHISELENRLNVNLFIRNSSPRKGLLLSSQGEQLYRYVVSGLESFSAGIREIKKTANSEEFVIGCTHEISHLYLMPRFAALQKAIGDDVIIRIITSDYPSMERSPDSRIDLMFIYNLPSNNESRFATIYKEAVTPVCSPEYFNLQKLQLMLTPSKWNDIVFLNLGKFHPGWATWDDWISKNSVDALRPHYQTFDNYVYILEAAAAGNGIALGWKGLIDRYLDLGILVPVRDDYTHFDRSLYVWLTDKGMTHTKANDSLLFFKQ
jgi:LysR family glycine cleavage system transcriptional activator